ncbi:NAD-dependent epimerase/dehydratase family protein [Streptomyces yaizuensis]|uniref:NAD-dependent epimerase/dehydratase family protein n=1 Tax=Streptomyces yaizuensis TaxID=2989713 RepID=A0ABQ5NV55_9ACTN|nr:NAD-dependent epimerase/dehydratase family protein [Streptomyces sp. YSPA8]GLF94028.1 NAD-dependent epimerase/dehydratase family protein [Streptomyces sp. YSPA8]
MRLLVLGGTEFAGRALVAAGVERGWEVTVFNRGTRPVPAGVETLVGDRTEPGGLAALEAGEWDVVVDTWAAQPRAVRDTARLLQGRVGRYVYVSSCSVYAFPQPVGFDESAPLVAGDPDAGEVEYPQAKRGGELAVLDVFGAERSLLVRAGLLLGPWENVDRLPWWLRRVAEGGPVLAPGPGGNPLQYIDIRDLAAWTLDAAAAGLHGPYNMVSEQGHATMEELLTACVRVTGSDAELRWVDARTVLDAGVEPWTELPVWVPREETPELFNAVYRQDVSKAVAAGLRCRPVAETVADTWAWMRTEDPDRPRRAPRRTVGLDRAVEERILADKE